MAYITTIVTLEDVHGEEADYEVGADVTYDPGDGPWGPEYEVGEPDISAAWSTLDESRLHPNPQQPGVLKDGWSDKVIDALTRVAEDDDGLGLDPDDYMWEVEYD